MGYLNFITLNCSFLSLSLWKSCVIVVSSFTLFFDGPPTRTKLLHVSNRCSLECYVNMILILCKFSCEHRLLTRPTTTTFCLFFIHFLTLLHTHFGLSHCPITHLSHCQCRHTIDGLCIHLIWCLCGNECNVVHDIL